ncbi:MAG: hypothetical protein H0W87_00065 [Actinobacteria bacterium]|nr:hypothetical protein [Actinomycetota bacterium]
MLRRTLVVAGAIALFGVFASAAMANHAWGTYHWGRTANPVPLTVIDTTSSAWTSYVVTAVADWDSSTVLGLTKTTGTANKRCAAVSGKIQVCNSTYGNNGWLGLASIWTASGTTHIAQATTKLNDTYFNTSTYNNPNEKAHVACQEIGHDFGLNHQDESGADFNTCMDYFSNTGTNASSTDGTHPNKGDSDQLLCIYDPNTSGRTLNSTSTTGRAHACTGTGHVDTSNSWSKTGAGLVARPGSENVLVTHSGRITKITIVRYANPIH